MKTYEAITVISNHIIDDGLCDAIILKGSIGRGDDDEFSDVDMYLIVRPNIWTRFYREDVRICLHIRRLCILRMSTLAFLKR